MVPILMAAPVLRGNVPAEEREKFLAIGEASAERGVGIARQVLTFGYGAAGGRVLVQVAFLVEEVAKLAERTFPKTISVRTSYPENVHCLEAEPAQIHQVLLNLSINARNAMPHGGKLTLSLRNFDVDRHYASMTPGAKAGPHVMMQVSDTGAGVRPHVIGGTLDQILGANGIGLAPGARLSAVLQIVKSHGGFMQVDNEAGQTNFKVFIPAAPFSVSSIGMPLLADIPTGSGEMILVVDNESGFREVTQAVLLKHGYRVLVAKDGPEALTLVARRGGEVQVMLTDMIMPCMDGVTLIRTVRKMQPEIKVILSSERNENPRTADVVELNIDDCLTKPYKSEELLLTLARLLNDSSLKPSPSTC
jgi:CheY-like chemotaxis protein